MATVQIFLSAVSAEFRSYRDALRRDLDRPNVTLKVQEDFIATGTETLDKLDTYIRQCDAAIHLVGDMTGALAQPPSIALVRQRYPDFGERLPMMRPFLQPDAPALSYTQWEAWLTLYHRKMLIIAVPTGGAARDADYRLDQAQRTAQQEHLGRLASVERYPEIHFGDANRLAVDVLRSGLQEVMASARVVARRVKAPPATRDHNRRYLRGYAFDPHVPMTFEPGEENEIVFSIRSEALSPGPCGDLIEVIDHDPASACFYEPVDLEHPDAIKQDGRTPSEADPGFHQQFVYAVAMTTIELFEESLGRRVGWSWRWEPKTQSTSFVQRLRIYPHALRSPRAYYDPEREAILFGYYPTPADLNPDGIYPEGLVFTCLSLETVAREVAVAILHGMYPALLADDSRETMSFKVAFADIVGLLQHFAVPGVLRHAIGRRGVRRSMGAVIGEVATQLGPASRDGRALRGAIGAYDQTMTWARRAPDPTDFARATDVADRAAVVVAAIFDAYIAVLDRRVIDTLREVAAEPNPTRDAAPPPELVEQLEQEAAETARHLLSMSVRALDYCPPVGVTAGDFLRALITADSRVEPQDASGYRTAIVDAFRAHGIYPDGFRSLSVDMLGWNRPSPIVTKLLRPLIDDTVRLWADRLSVLDDASAEQRFGWLRRWQSELHQRFSRFVRALPSRDREALAPELGLDPAMEQSSLRVFPPRVTSRTTFGSGRVFIALVQNQSRIADADQTPADLPPRGGCTVVVKFGTWEIEHVVCKPIRVR